MLRDNSFSSLHTCSGVTYWHKLEAGLAKSSCMHPLIRNFQMLSLSLPLSCLMKVTLAIGFLSYLLACCLASPTFNGSIRSPLTARNCPERFSHRPTTRCLRNIFGCISLVVVLLLLPLEIRAFLPSSQLGNSTELKLCMRELVVVVVVVLVYFKAPMSWPP